MNILVLAGGLSPERDVSLSTGTQVCNALRRAGERAFLADLFYGVETLPADPRSLFASAPQLPPRPVGRKAPDLAAVRAARGESGLGGIGKGILELARAADIVFLALHGEPGENGMIQAMFDMMGVRYTGAPYMGSALAMDKGVSKSLFLEAGIPTPEGRVFRRGEALGADIPFPCIVKPCSGGSSIGVTKAANPAQLEAAAREAFLQEDRILVERFHAGREFTCGVLGGAPLPCAEVIPLGGFYDYTHKYQDGLIREICPAPIGAALEAELRELTLAIFHALQLRVYARMDFIYDEAEKKLYALEANTLPGLTPTSHFPQMAAAAGMGYEALCLKIIELSLQK